MNKLNKLNLIDLELKTFTKQDALDYCQINNINPDNIIELDLSDNELTDISGIKVFKNLEKLYLLNNKLKDILVLKDLIKLQGLYIRWNNIKDISVINSLINLKELSITNLELKSNQIKYFKNLAYLWCKKGFKDMSVINKLNKNINIIK